MSYSSLSLDSASSTCQGITGQSFGGHDISELSFDVSEHSLSETTISIESEATETSTIAMSTNAGYKLVFESTHVSSEI